MLRTKNVARKTLQKNQLPITSRFPPHKIYKIDTFIASPSYSKNIFRKKVFKKFKIERVHFVYGLCLSLISSNIYFSNRSTNELRWLRSCKLEHIYLEGIPGKQNFYDTIFAHCWHDSLCYLLLVQSN